MAESINRANRSFLSYVNEIERELYDTSHNLDKLTDDDLTDRTYISLSRHFDHIEDMFNDASDVAKELALDQSNPELYNILEAKSKLSDLFGYFNRLRNSFTKRYQLLHGKSSEREEELSRDYVPVPNIQPDEETLENPESEEEFSDEDADFEELLALEDELEQEKLEKDARQKKLAEEARKKETRRYEENRLREERARQIGLDVREGKQFSEADLRNELLRQEEERTRIARENSERIARNNEIFQEYQRKMDESLRFERLDKSHLDYSKDLYSPNPEVPAVYNFTPFGTVPLYSSPPINDSSVINPAGSNAKIYSSITQSEAYTSSEGRGPVPVSSAYERQMRFNLEMARTEYYEARGTPAEKEAAHKFMEQRAAYSDLRSDIQSGRIKLDEPVAVPYSAERKKSPEATVPPQVFYSFTPTGVVGSPIENGHLSANTYTYTKPDIRNNTIYTPDSPMRVTPEYENQLYDRMKAATTVMNSVVEQSSKSSPPPISPSFYSELKVATDAYLGFRRAKAAGTVVVSQDAEKSVPDYSMWQQQYTAGNSRVNVGKILGSTSQSQINYNKVSKGAVEEVSASILSRDSKLKRESVSAQYFKAVGYKVSSYSSYAMTTLSRKMYYLIQSGDDNALRTIETGRYYISTGVAVGRAIHNFAPVKSTAESAAELAKWEFKRFGTLTSLDNKAISGQMNTHIQAARELKKEIKSLSAGDRILSEKERIHLMELQHEHRALNGQIRKEAGLLKYRHQNELKLQFAQSLKEEHKGIVTIKQVDEKMRQVQAEAYKQMKEKFGDEKTDTERSFKLLRATDRSLAKEIADLKDRASKLKSQIKLLQNKGSALTAAERVQLKSLMDQHKSLSDTLRKLVGLQKSRGQLKEKLDALASLRKDMARNRNAWSGGFYALQNLILKPIYEGSETGSLGLAHGIRFATNRHIRRLIKTGLKGSMFMTKVGMELVMPGSSQAVSAAYQLTKNAVNAKVALTKKTIKTAVKTTVKTAAGITKQAAIRLTPPKIKTAVSTSIKQSKALSAAFRKMTDSAKKKFAESAVGRGIAAVRRTFSNASAALKAVFSVIGSVVTKALIVFVCVFLVVGVVTAFMTAFAGSATTSVILSPYEADDGRISLMPYVEVLQKGQATYDADIDALLNSSDYEKVVVKNGTGLLNNYKDILCMTAVKMDQDLDLETNEELEEYLLHLFEISHTYTTQEVYWEHNPGCEERTKTVEVKEYCDGCVLTVNGLTDCKGHITYKEEIEYYCPGHLDLYITKYVLSMDEMMDYEDTGNSIYGGAGIGSFDSSLGGVSAKYEAGGINPGMISSGAGDHGGKSYGTWQLSSNVGSLRSFMNWLKNVDTEIYTILSAHELASSGFDEAWQSVATSHYERFQKLQASYIYSTYCGPYIARVKDYYGVDLSRSKALTELAFSTSVQFGPGAVSVLGKVTPDMTDEEIIKTCYAYKRNNVASLFASSSVKIQNSLKNNRFVTEEKDLLSLINTSYDTEEPDSGEEEAPEDDKFWTDEKRDWAQILYDQDWVELYDVYFSPASGSMMDPMTEAQIEKIIEECKEDYPELSEDRETAIRNALSLVGKVQYYWGGGHEGNLEPGWNDKWGTPAPPSSSPTTTYTTWGLDCSGFIRWIFLTTYDKEVYWCSIKQMTNMNGIVSRDAALPGDLANISDGSGDYTHIGMYLYTNDAGERVFVHSGGGLSGVSLTTEYQTGFDVYHSPYIYK